MEPPLLFKMRIIIVSLVKKSFCSKHMFGGDVVCEWKVLLWPADILSLVACSGNSSQVSHPPIYTCCTKEGNKTTLFPCQSKVFFQLISLFLSFSLSHSFSLHLLVLQFCFETCWRALCTANIFS